MLKGLKKIEEESAQQAAAFVKDRIKWIYLGDKEYAEIRFISDQEDILRAKFHIVEEMTPKGRRFQKKYCTFVDLGQCTRCSEGTPFKNFVFAWAYVYAIYHTQQNPQLNSNPDAPKWKAGKTKDGKTFYKEEVGMPCVFRLTVGKNNANQKMLSGFAGEYGSLTDRDYKYSREGASLDTTYQLFPRDPSKLKPEVAESFKDLPDLGQVIIGKIISYSGEERKETPEKETATATESDGSDDKELF